MNEAGPVVVNWSNENRHYFKGKFVIIIDDLVDEGKTLCKAVEIIENSNPVNLITLVGVKKIENIEMNPDYYCFNLGYDNDTAKKRWLFGFGMDIRNEFRDCDYIAEYEKI